jgi:HSP20 family protein
MTKKRKKRNSDDDDLWSHGDSFFDDFFEFGDIDREFDRMRELMDQISRRAARGELGSEEQGPYVYGFSMRVGPDGKPNIQEFGNTKPPKRLEGETNHEKYEVAEREPLTDVIECKDEISITLEVPGVDKDEIELTVEEDRVAINVDTPQRKYFKEIPLKIKVDPKTSKATYKNGVLDIILKKVPQKDKKGKKVKIE